MALNRVAVNAGVTKVVDRSRPARRSSRSTSTPTLSGKEPLAPDLPLAAPRLTFGRMAHGNADVVRPI